MKKSLLLVLLTFTFSHTASAYTFPTNLKVGSRGSDVKNLQILLNSDPDTRIATTGAGSPGKETLVFGPATARAVIKFQNKYAKETLTPAGLTKGTGIVGALTRKKLSTLGGGSTTPVVTKTTKPTETGTPIILFTKNLSAGLTNDPEVKKLQTALALDGSLYPERAITGNYDFYTVQAVKKFQDRYNLATPEQKLTPAYGSVGPKTALQLYKVFGGISVAPPIITTPTTTPVITIASGGSGSAPAVSGGSAPAPSAPTTPTVSTPQVTTYTINTSTGPHGTISPSGIVAVPQGGSQAYTITPDPGYMIDVLYIDGVSVATSTTPTFSNIQSSRSISVTFAPTVIPAQSSAPTTYTLSLTNSGNGAIDVSPTGITCISTTCSTSHTPGTVVTLTATPNAGYTFSTWGGSCTGTATTCTTTIAQATSVSATFAAIPVPALSTSSGGFNPDANGWSVFTASIDTRKIYVSNSLGSDTNNGLSPSTPVKTLSKGKSLLRDTYPDWLLLKKGDTWTDETIGSICPGGRSATEPMLISSYGTGPRPLIKTNPTLLSANKGLYTVGSVGCPNSGDYMAIVGLEFYAYTRDPNSPNFDSTTVSLEHPGFAFLHATNWMLLEDNKFSFYAGNTIQAYPSGTFQNTSLRRNIIANNYAISTHAQGLFSSNTNDFLLEENMWDHNGWNPLVQGASSTIFRRSMYLSHGSGRTVVRGNIDANGASGGMQVRTGGIAEDNLSLRNPVAIVFGSNQNNPSIVISGAIRNNVILDAKDIDTQLQGTGITISGNAASAQGAYSPVDGLEVTGNIIAHNVHGTGNIVGISLSSAAGVPFSNTNVHDNIVYDWSRALWPNPNDHRANGYRISIATSSVNTFFQNNIIQQVNSGFVGSTSNIDATASAVTKANNIYWSAESDPPVIWSKGWFETTTTNALSWANWVSRTGETGSTRSLVNFVDPNRTIETYMASLGMTPTYEAFMLKVRQQSKDTWDPRFTAAAVNNYIRAGFSVVPTP